jgi:hypothetical protein
MGLVEAPLRSRQRRRDGDQDRKDDKERGQQVHG